MIANIEDLASMLGYQEGKLPSIKVRLENIGLGLRKLLQKVASIQL